MCQIFKRAIGWVGSIRWVGSIGWVGAIGWVLVLLLWWAGCTAGPRQPYTPFPTTTS